MASPQFLKLLDRLRALPRARSFDVHRRRQAMEAMAFPVADDIAVAPTTIGGLAAEWIAAPGATSGIVVYLHGGGFVMGSLRTHRKLAGDIARASGARVLLLDYPLAPEHPFPAAIHAIATSYAALHKEVPQAPVALAGDSAGGGLVVSTLIALRAAGAELPRAAVCISPWADLTRASEWSESAHVDPVVGPDDLVPMRSCYLRDAAPDNPLASPVLADLRGMPPLLIQVGEAEILLEDSRRLAARAREAGVDVTLEVAPEMVHVWHVFAGRVPESTDAVNRLGQFVREHLASP